MALDDDATGDVYTIIENCLGALVDLKVGEKLTVPTVKQFRKMKKKIRSFEKAYKKEDEDSCDRAEDLYSELDDAGSTLRELGPLMVVGKKWTTKMAELAEEAFNYFGF